MFLINYCNGFEIVYEGNSLEGAKKEAEEYLSYTGESVIIYDNKGKQVSRLPFYGVEASEDDFATASFGSYGFYSEWLDEQVRSL